MLVVVPLVITVGIIVIVAGVIATVCYIRFSSYCIMCSFLNSHIMSTLTRRRQGCGCVRDRVVSVILCYYFTL